MSALSESDHSLIHSQTMEWLLSDDPIETTESHDISDWLILVRGARVSSPIREGLNVHSGEQLRLLTKNLRQVIKEAAMLLGFKAILFLGCLGSSFGVKQTVGALINGAIQNLFNINVGKNANLLDFLFQLPSKQPTRKYGSMICSTLWVCLGLRALHLLDPCGYF
ncbi:hypothetical protein QQP08_018172 [Theobroma cacao]|nr:hypothetical protein QQP08_018172 [Theobroma cacao]